MSSVRDRTPELSGDESADAEDAAEPESAMAALPTELLLQLLSLLPTEALCYAGAVRGVCRRWRRASECACLWRRRDLVWSSSARDRDVFLRAMVVAPELRTVTFQPGVHVPDCVLQGCSRVRCLLLTADGVCPSGDVVLALVQHYSARAETLRLEVNLSRAVSTAVLHTVAGCRSLRSLRLAGTLRVSAEGIAALARGCPGLRELDVERLADWGPKLVAEMVAAKGGQLTSLVLPGRHAVVDGRVLRLVASSCKGLTALGADYADAAALIGHLPALRSLRLWYSYSAPSPDFLLHQASCCRRRAGDAEAAADEQGCHRGGAAAALARLQHLTAELADDPEFVLLVLGACVDLRSLRLSGDFLDRQVDALLSAAPKTVKHFEYSSFTLRAVDALDALERHLPRLYSAIKAAGASL